MWLVRDTTVGRSLATVNQKQNHDRTHLNIRTYLLWIELKFNWAKRCNFQELVTHLGDATFALSRMQRQDEKTMGQIVEGIMPIDMRAVPHINIEGFALADGEGQDVGQSLGSFLGSGDNGPVA